MTVEWYSVWGLSMTPEEWNDPAVRCVSALMESTREGEESLLVLFNSSPDNAVFTLPADLAGRSWVRRLDTREPRVILSGAHGAGQPGPNSPQPGDGGHELLPAAVEAGSAYTLLPHSLAAFTAPSRAGTPAGGATPP